MDILLTLYYDGNCPFCAAEMARLRRWDSAGYLEFIDIAAPGFDAAVLGVEMADLQRELHSLAVSGELLVGIDSMLAAYTLVGRGYLVWPLRVRPLRPLLRTLYRWFARNRYQASAWLGYRPAVRGDDRSCDSEHCEIGSPFLRK
jgi:predicted DCC family thiol-disulfide oxidoreductase YuxK